MGRVTANKVKTEIEYLVKMADRAAVEAEGTVSEVEFRKRAETVKIFMGYLRESVVEWEKGGLPFLDDSSANNRIGKTKCAKLTR